MVGSLPNDFGTGKEWALNLGGAGDQGGTALAADSKGAV